MWENDSPESPITPRDPRVPGVARQPPREGDMKRSVVGSTLTIKGEVSGGEDRLTLETPRRAASATPSPLCCSQYSLPSPLRRLPAPRWSHTLRQRVRFGRESDRNSPEEPQITL